MTGSQVTLLNRMRVESINDAVKLNRGHVRNP
jgi:hypothetical protein